MPSSEDLIDQVEIGAATFLCFRKTSLTGPLFAVREFDAKVLRPSKPKKGGTWLMDMLCGQI